MDRLPPESLYKFRSFNDSHCNALINNQIYFALGHRLNDPFDCSSNFPTVIADRDSLSLFLIETQRPILEFLVSSKKFNNIEDAALDIAATELSNNELMEDCHKQVTPYWQVVMDMIERTFTLSFATSYQSKLMWSHYSAEQTGYCIRFNYSKLRHCLPKHIGNYIEYTSQPFNIYKSFLKEEIRQNIQDIIFSKSPDWRYENEYRFTLHAFSKSVEEEFDKKVIYPVDCVDCIFFGLAAKDEDKQQLISSLEGRDILFKDVYVKPGTYDLYCRDYKAESMT